MTNVESTTEVKRTKVADHALLDANRNVVEDEELARGIRYKLIANGQIFDWLYDEATESERVMLSIFGAKTLATNETSQARNNAKGEASADDQIAAVRDRFTLIRSEGKWIDRTREGVGVAMNKDALTEAICRVMVNQGKLTQAQVDGGKKAEYRERVENDAAYVRKARQVSEVRDAYAAIVGRPTVTVDDLV